MDVVPPTRPAARGVDQLLRLADVVVSKETLYKMKTHTGHVPVAS